MIEIKDIRKSFGTQPVLKGISALFDEGKCNLIIGKSGSGKTVTLKCMVGLFEPDSGHILFDGRNITEMDFHQRKVIRREIGMLFQGTALFDSLTVEENVRFPLDMFTNQTAEEKKERVNFCLKRVNLSDTNKKYPGELSGGMKKRVGIARALAIAPELLLFDEPTSALDPELVQDVLDTMKNLAQEGWTMVVVSHEIKFALDVATKVVVMDGGVIVEQGAPEELFRNPQHERTRRFLQQIRAEA